MSFAKGLIEIMINTISDIGSRPKIKKLVKEIEDLNNLKKKLPKLFNNPKRKEILSLLKNKELNIKDISKKINLSYTNTLFHIKLLKDYNYINVKRKKGAIGREVIISLNKITKETILKNLDIQIKEKEKEFSKELIKTIKKTD